MENNTNRSSDNRLYFIDNLRVLLTVLVVFHHVAITYGANGGWYYYEHTQNGVVNSILSNFTGFNQMFFMSLFFLISGYLTPGAYDRKGITNFLKDRALRLGIPLFIFFFTMSPIVEYVKDVTVKNSTDTFWEFYKSNILIKFNLCPGPLWFIETLLIFSIVYAIWRAAFKYIRKVTQARNRVLTNKKILLFILFLSIFTFAGRTLFPVGNEYFHLQLGYYPHYISLYIAGILAYRNNWLEASNRVGKLWSFLALPMVIIISMVIEPLLFSLLYTNESMVCGGVTWQSLFHSSFESFGCVGMSITFLYVFREKVNTQKGVLAGLLAENSYTIYIIHAPIIVLLALSMRDVILYPLCIRKLSNNILAY